MTYYHVVTDRPMYVGQQIVFDANHHSGVYMRVEEKWPIVQEIYAHPEKYDAAALEHHTRVALRELALEEVRKESYPQYPSRLSCLYVSEEMKEAEEWGKFFVRIGRPTYHIVRLDVQGRCFRADATNCFDGVTDKQENLRMAHRYWQRLHESEKEKPVYEILVDGCITVLEIVKEIGANLG